jgi:hypothetical protein
VRGPRLVGGTRLSSEAPRSIVSPLEPVHEKRTSVNIKTKIAAAAAVGAAVAATTLAIPAYATTSVVYQNASNRSLCLDADAGTGAVNPGANVTAWFCNGGSNQKWTVLGDGTIRNVANSSLCLDANAQNGDVGPGANVTAWPCNFGSNQRWLSTAV